MYPGTRIVGHVSARGDASARLYLDTLTEDVMFLVEREDLDRCNDVAVSLRWPQTPQGAVTSPKKAWCGTTCIAILAATGVSFLTGAYVGMRATR